MSTTTGAGGWRPGGTWTFCVRGHTGRAVPHFTAGGRSLNTNPSVILGHGEGEGRGGCAGQTRSRGGASSLGRPLSRGSCRAPLHSSQPPCVTPTPLSRPGEGQGAGSPASRPAVSRAARRPAHGTHRPCREDRRPPRGQPVIPNTAPKRTRGPTAPPRAHPAHPRLAAPRGRPEPIPLHSGLWPVTSPGPSAFRLHRASEGGFPGSVRPHAAAHGRLNAAPRPGSHFHPLGREKLRSGIGLEVRFPKAGEGERPRATPAPPPQPPKATCASRPGSDHPGFAVQEGPPAAPPRLPPPVGPPRQRACPVSRLTEC